MGNAATISGKWTAVSCTVSNYSHCEHECKWITTKLQNQCVINSFIKIIWMHGIPSYIKCVNNTYYYTMYQRYDGGKLVAAHWWLENAVCIYLTIFKL